MTHELKTWPGPFGAMRLGLKSFEVRKDDRNFAVGDTLILKEFDPVEKKYSGMFLEAKVIWKLPGGQFGIALRHCVMSVKLTGGNCDYKKV